MSYIGDPLRCFVFQNATIFGTGLLAVLLMAWKFTLNANGVGDTLSEICVDKVEIYLKIVMCMT